MIYREWAMPNKNTFTIKPIKELIEKEMTQGIWLDPFAKENKLATICLSNDSKCYSSNTKGSNLHIVIE